MRDLRNHGGRVLDRVTRGESVTVTRDGVPVALLHPVPRPGPTAQELITRARRLPVVNADRWRRDVDALVDQAL